MFGANNAGGILAYFGPTSPGAGNHPKNAGKRFCNGKESFCNGVAKRDGDSGIAKQPRKGQRPFHGGAPRTCNGVAFEHAGEPSGKYLIAPFGDWKNGNIVQRVDASAAENLKRNMAAVWAMIKSDIENPCPVHYEHPDDLDGEEVPKVVDKTPYGRVRSLEIRDDGIYAEIEWLPGFESLPKRLQISPRWNADPLGGGIVRPVRLISIGLTRRPNISRTSFVNNADGNAPIPNFETQQKEPYMDKEILILLGYTDEEAQMIIDKAEGAPTDVLERIKKALEAKQQLANSKDALKASQAARAKLVVANAVRAGKIAEFQRASAEAILANAEDFEAEEKKIADAPAAVKTEPKTDGIEKGEKERAKSQQDAQSKFASIVAEKQNSGMDYNAAWNLAKNENAELYGTAYPSNV